MTTQFTLKNSLPALALVCTSLLAAPVFASPAQSMPVYTVTPVTSLVGELQRDHNHAIQQVNYEITLDVMAQVKQEMASINQDLIANKVKKDAKLSAQRANFSANSIESSAVAPK
ncbi:hypothetical protein [Paraferrimonas haliotis]|uniref:hypothetical protein n=1 Tax=Paraferrimonas haliotis TaxID=2013866 RepID=UPI000BA9C87B|nr:hypothetical protein [Paraferrimonas haliotis]